jgi:hypothetical protein
MECTNNGGIWWIIPSSALLRRVRRFETHVRDYRSVPNLRGQWSWTCWLLKMRPMGSPETSVLTTSRCAVTQKKEEFGSQLRRISQRTTCLKLGVGWLINCMGHSHSLEAIQEIIRLSRCPKFPLPCLLEPATWPLPVEVRGPVWWRLERCKATGQFLLNKKYYSLSSLKFILKSMNI